MGADQQLLIAMITGGFAVIVAMIQKTARDTRLDKLEVQRSLGRIEGKLDSHLLNHNGHKG